MKLRIEVREDEFTLYCEGVKAGTFRREPDNGYITPCFTYSFLWDFNGAVVIEYDGGEVEATLQPGDTYECKHECSMEDPKPED